MRCERFSKWIPLFAFVAACSREQPAPPPATATQRPTATTGGAAPESAPPPIPVATGGSYDEAMIWLKSAPAFRFVIVEGGVRADGTMTRKTVGAEAIEFRMNQENWRAESGAEGVTWQKRVGGNWKKAPSPDYGSRLFQRATLAIDPAKKEGTAQLVAHEGASNHYRFTDANLGDIHDVWVSTADNHVERIRIGKTMEMTIQP